MPTVKIPEDETTVYIHHIGPYEKGVEYEVDELEATRLIENKGFVLVEED